MLTQRIDKDQALETNFCYCPDNIMSSSTDVDIIASALGSFGEADLSMQWKVAKVLAQETVTTDVHDISCEDLSADVELLLTDLTVSDSSRIARAGRLLSRAAAGSTKEQLQENLADAIINKFLIGSATLSFSQNHCLIISYFIQDLALLLNEITFRRLMVEWVEAVAVDARCDSLGDIRQNFSLRVCLGGDLLAAREVSDDGGKELLLCSIIDCCQLRSNKRSSVLKALLAPCLRRILSECSTSTNLPRAREVLSILWVVVAEGLRGDAHSSSLLAAIIVHVSAAEYDASTRCLFEKEQYWGVVLSFFLHDDSVVRKRGAYLTESFLAAFDSSSRIEYEGKKAGGMTSLSKKTTHQEQTVMSKKASGRRRRDRSSTEKLVDSTTAQSLKQDVDSSHVGSQEYQKNQRHWVHNFLAIYGQIDGCRYVHLIEQVLGHIESLCLLLTRPSTTVHSEMEPLDASLYPTLDFRWIQVILQCLFRGQLMAIRKHALKLILSGGLPFHISEASIDWVVKELLGAIDAPLYFPPHFSGANVTEYCDNEYPGRLLPGFLKKLLSECAIVGESALFQKLVRGIVSVVCGGDTGIIKPLESLTTCKWVLSVFLLPEVQQILLDSPSCLSVTHLVSLRSFLQDRVMSVNDVIWNQILSGALPLFLCSTEPSLVGPQSLDIDCSCSKELRISIIGIIVGFDMWGRSVVLEYALLKKALLRWSTELKIPCEMLPENSNPLLSFEYALAASVISSTTTAPCKMSTDFLILLEDAPSVQKTIGMLMKNVTKLYASPYMSHEMQLFAVWFVRGIFSSLQYAGNLTATSDAYQVRVFAETAVSYLANSCTLSDLALYFSFVLNEVMGYEVADVEVSLPIASGVASLEHVRLCSSAFAGLLSIPCVQLLHRISLPSSCSEIKRLVTSALGTMDRFCSLLENNSVCGSTVILPMLCCSESILSSLSAVACSNERLISLEAHHYQTFLRMCHAAHRFQVPEAHKFRADVSRSTDIVDSPISHLMSDVIADCSGLYGKFSSKCLNAKWSILKFAIPILLTNSTMDSEHGLLLHILEDIRDSVETCPVLVLPEVLSCCQFIVVSTLGPISRVASHATSNFCTNVVSGLLQSCWSACMGGESLHTASIFSFIRMIFHPDVLAHHDNLHILGYYNNLVEIGVCRRPHILQNMLLQLFFVWKTKPELCIPFLKQFKQLLLYKEFVPDEYQSVQVELGDTELKSNATINPDRGVSVPVVRLVLLQFLDQLGSSASLISPGVQSGLNDLILELLELNFEVEYVKSAPLGSDKYGEKLRAWQALCILSKYVNEDVLRRVVELVFMAIKQNVSHSIRVHMEIFLASLLYSYPDKVVPPLLLELDEFNHNQQVLGSLFITLGHCTESFSFFASGAGSVFVSQVLSAIYPWLMCSPGLPRTIAQLVVYRLVKLRDQFSVDDAFLRIWKFLDTNIETIKMRARQIRFFKEYYFQSKCTLPGLLEIRKGGDDISVVQGVIYAPSTDDIVPTHLLTIITEFLKESSVVECNSSAAITPIVDPDLSNSIGTLQTKRIPLDDLQLSLRQELGGGARSGAGEIKRQDVIVCASLVSKPTNLGGLARTCEIFAVSKLVIADMSITQGEIFQGIAVSSGSWLPMEEVPVHQVGNFLKDCKKRGYTIIGLEQTDSSISLETCDLPSKSVLLLGREREGIPVELLHDVDICVEIPQFGVTRSLNVHVSASLALWEITAQNTSYIATNEKQIS